MHPKDRMDSESEEEPEDMGISLQGGLVVDKQDMDFTEDVARMRAHIRQHHSRVFLPGQTRWLAWLDTTVASCVLFVCIVSPVETAMTTTATTSPIFFITLGCNCIFLFESFT